MKQLLRTYAFGLLTATAIIGIYYFFIEDHSPEVVNLAMTETDMISELESSGYFIYQTEPNIIDQSENNKAKQEPTEDEDVNSNTADQDTDETNDNLDFTLTIEPGMSISQIANYLSIANIIDSEAELIDYLVENDYATNIQVGQFNLNQEMSLEEVVEIIVN